MKVDKIPKRLAAPVSLSTLPFFFLPTSFFPCQQAKRALFTNNINLCYYQPTDVAVLIDKILKTTTNDELATFLLDHTVWYYPRGDLSSWIAVLDKFDSVLEEVVKAYDLDRPQIKPFDQETKRITLSILGYTRLLLENCTNRKLFSSYDVSHLSDLPALTSSA